MSRLISRAMVGQMRTVKALAVAYQQGSPRVSLVELYGLAALLWLLWWVNEWQSESEERS